MTSPQLAEIGEFIAEVELSLEGMALCFELFWQRLQSGQELDHQHSLAAVWLAIATLKQCATQLGEAAEPLESLQTTN